VLAGSQLASNDPIKLEFPVWPELKSPELGQSRSRTKDDRFATAESRIRRRQWFFGVAAAPGVQYRYVNEEPAVAEGAVTMRGTVALSLGVVQTAIGFFKIGVVSEVDVTRGHASRTFSSPSGMLLEQERVDLDGVRGGFGVDLRLDHVAGVAKFFSMSLSVTAVLGVWRHHGEVMKRDAITDTNAGVALTWRDRAPIETGITCFAVRNKGCIHAFVGLHAAWLKTPTFDYTYTGVGADYKRSGDAFVLHTDFEVGLEW
jgi:hypothetical protein